MHIDRASFSCIVHPVAGFSVQQTGHTTGSILFFVVAQGKLSDVDVNSVEARLTKVTNRYNDAKRNIADAKAKLEASQRDADNLKDRANDLVRF